MARVVFLQRIWQEYHGPEIISAVLKQRGHEVNLCIGPDAASFLDQIRPRDIVAFSTMTGEQQWALRTAQDLKRSRDVFTVFGGPHPTHCPEIVRHPAVDAVCCGEGEGAMLDLAQARDQDADISAIPNLAVKSGPDFRCNPVRALIPDLDVLPAPDRGLYDKYPLIRAARVRTFVASRGCPHSCAFCFNESLRTLYAGKGPYVRFLSPARLVEQVREAAGAYRFQAVYFLDDLFALDKNWLREFSVLYPKRVGKEFICSAHVSTLDDETIGLLKDAGCVTVSFGIETGNEELRRKIFNKNISNAAIESAGRALQRRGLKAMAFNIIGFPGETVSDALETIALNARAGVAYPRCSLLAPYPGTRLAEAACRAHDDISSTQQQSGLSFPVAQPGELYNLHCFFQTAVLWPASRRAIKRLIRFRPNIAFKLWWGLVYFYVLVRSEQRGVWQTLLAAYRTFVPALMRYNFKTSAYAKDLGNA